MTILADQPYILLSTRKRDGSFVPTPVWCVGNERHIYAFSAGEAGKVKRLRNFSECQIAACDFKGKRTGNYSTAKAVLIDGQEACDAHQALRKKYGWQMKLLDLGANISGRTKRRAYIRIDLD